MTMTQAGSPTTTPEVIPPQVPSLPHWETTPPDVDVTGARFLVLLAGGGEAAVVVARDWVAQAERIGPTELGSLDDLDGAAERAALAGLIDRARTGVRVMVVGGQYEVLQLLARLRHRGAIESELRSFVTDTTQIPVFCGHCQTVFRAVAAPGSEADCSGCGRRLAVHEHMAATLGSFLASDAGATEL